MIWLLFYPNTINADNIYVLPEEHAASRQITYSEKLNLDSNFTTSYQAGSRSTGNKEDVDPFATQIVMPRQTKSYIIQNNFSNITIFKFTTGKTNKK